MPKIVPFLWFDNNAEEAMNLYTSIFKDVKLGTIQRYGKGMPGPEGTVMTAAVNIFGQDLVFLNGGPIFKFTEAFSLVVNCDSQAQVDEYWAKLTADGGKESQCGWLKDKFGLSWQIIPTEMYKLFGDKDRGKAGRAMEAMMKMKKIDLAKMKAAFDGK